MKLCLTTLFAVGAFLLTSCEKETASLPELEERLAALKVSTSKLKQSVVGMRTELQRAEYVRDSLRSTVDETYVAAKKAESSARLLAAEFNQYRNNYRETILRRAPGMELGDINVGGQPFHGVCVKALDPWELTIAHKGGMAKFALADLPDQLRELFAFDPSAGPKPVDAVSPFVAELSKSSVSEASGALPRSAPIASVTPAPPIIANPSDHASGGKSTGGSNISVSGRRIGRTITDSKGHTMEVISSFRGSTGGGGIISGSTGKGTKASVP